MTFANDTVLILGIFAAGILVGGLAGWLWAQGSEA